MKRLRQEDPTRRHTFVTGVLAVIAALVVLAIEDPSQRKGDGSSTPMASGKSRPLARHAPYRPRAPPAPVVSFPAVGGGGSPRLLHKK